MKKVYMCISTDILQAGHINIIQKAAELGEVTVGVLCDECVSLYEKYPIIPLEERMKIIKSIKGVNDVIVQNDIYYDENLRKLHPDYVIHGDNWNKGYLKKVKERAINQLAEWGGEVVEVPYYKNADMEIFTSSMKELRGLAEVRRQRLRKQLAADKLVRVMVSYDGLSALIVEKTYVMKEDGKHQFDAFWLSSLCDSTVMGKPDIELVDITSRLRIVEEIMEITTKPIIFDADTGGKIEHFSYNIRTLERVGVSAVIIEDKVGLKRNSLLGNEVEQHQDSIENFCEKIRVGKAAVVSKNFMLIARIESLILENGMEDALERAERYVEAGADGIMIHSRSNKADEILEFCDRFRAIDGTTPLVVVPTTYGSVYEKELKQHGVNIVIYANHLLRAAFPAMKQVSLSILENERCKEANESCMSIKDILSLIPIR